MESKIWIYKANRILSEEEAAKAKNYLEQFIESWKAHGTKLDASYELRDNLFVVLKLNEASQMATGCSIDESVHFIQQLGQALQVDFFDRTQLALKINDEITLMNMHDLAQAYESGKVNDNTLMFDTLVKDSDAYEREFVKPLSKSWLKQVV